MPDTVLAMESFSVIKANSLVLWSVHGEMLSKYMCSKYLLNE